MKQFWFWMKDNGQTLLILLFGVPFACMAFWAILRDIWEPPTEKELARIERKIKLEQSYKDAKQHKKLVIKQQELTLNPHVLDLDDDISNLYFVRIENSEVICYHGGKGLQCKWKEDQK